YQNPGSSADAMATLLVKTTPFDDAELDRITTAIRESSFRPLWLGRRGGPDPMVRRLLLSEDRKAVYREYHDATGLDISPVTDDRPFFFDMIDPLASLFRAPRPEWKKHIYYFVRALDISMLHQLLLAACLVTGVLLLAPLLLRLRDLRGV